MNRALGVTAGIGVAGLVAMAWMFQWTATSVGGVEETRELEETLRGAYGRLFTGDPPLRVSRMPGAARGDTWRWLVEGDLAEGTSERDLERALERIVVRALGAGIGKNRPSGVRVRILRPDRSALQREFDATGRILGEGAGIPPSSSPGGKEGE